MIRVTDDAKNARVSKIRRKTAMSTQERGVYQPQEDFTTYEDYPEEEGRSRLPLMIVIALVVVAAFAGVVWLAYNQGVEHGRAGAPPIVAAPAGPARTPPDETQTASGQPGTPYTGLKIYGEPVPPDEEAANSALAPQTTPDATADTTTAVQTTVVPQGEEPTRLSATEPEPAPIEVTPAPAPAPRPPVTVATAHPPQTTAPVPTPAPAASQTLDTVPITPEVTSPPSATAPQVAIAPEPAPAAARTGGAATSGRAVLQIGSFPSEALANAAWDKFRRGHASTVTGLSSDVVAVQLPGKGTWYRLRIGPFADRGAAASRCAQLKAQGATCLVAVP